eukprot:m.9167 g.9167  ORF g.9167 m.9167 type:complete len:197 (-) comp5430_c0_seq2:781-1371(-)
MQLKDFVEVMCTACARYYQKEVSWTDYFMELCWDPHREKYVAHEAVYILQAVAMGHCGPVKRSQAARADFSSKGPLRDMKTATPLATLKGLLEMEIDDAVAMFVESWNDVFTTHIEIDVKIFPKSTLIENAKAYIQKQLEQGIDVLFLHHFDDQVDGELEQEVNGTAYHAYGMFDESVYHQFTLSPESTDTRPEHS